MQRSRIASPNSHRECAIRPNLKRFDIHGLAHLSDTSVNVEWRKVRYRGSRPAARPHGCQCLVLSIVQYALAQIFRAML